MNKIFTIIITLFPILSVYSCGINNLSIADLLLVLIFPVLLLKSIKIGIKKMYLSIYIFLIYLFLTNLIQYAIDSNTELMSTLRFVLYILTLILGVKLFNLKFSINILRKVSLLISYYTILQFIVFYFLKLTLPWKISFIPIMDNSFIIKEQSSHYLQFYRPTGIFLEPTHLSQFMFLILILSLFREENKNIKEAIIFTIAILCSGSSMGFLLLIFVWIIFCIKTFKYKISIKNILIFMLISMLILMIIPVIFKIEYFSKIVTRMIGENGFNGAAVGYRFDSIKVIIDNKISIINRIIGYGRGMNDVYFTTIPYLIYCNGLIGANLYIYIMVKNILNLKKWRFILALGMIVLSIGSEIMINFGFMWYSIFLYANEGE